MPVEAGRYITYIDGLWSGVLPGGALVDVREDIDMADLPPPVTQARFEELQGATAEQVRRRAAPLVRELHSFLNEGSCLRDIQRNRRQWKPRTREVQAFSGDDFPVEHEHWYTYNAGGRNEAQFNVGMFPGYLRVGLGFELTKKMHGDPEAVQAAFGAFRNALRKRQESFDRLARANSLRIEWRPAGRHELEYVPTPKVSGWLLRPRSVPEWIFVGRLLHRGKDAAVLEDVARLKEAMEAVFKGLKPLWKEAQDGAAGYWDQAGV